jgi:hypothetical protein
MYNFKNLNELQEFFSSPNPNANKMLNINVNNNAKNNLNYNNDFVNKNIIGNNMKNNFSNSKGFTFNESLKGSFTTSDFNHSNKNNRNNPISVNENNIHIYDVKNNKNIKPNNLQKDQKLPRAQNIHLIRAISNLLDEFDLTQLNYLKRIIDKKIKGDPESII